MKKYLILFLLLCAGVTYGQDAVHSMFGGRVLAGDCAGEMCEWEEVVPWRVAIALEKDVQQGQVTCNLIVTDFDNVVLNGVRYSRVGQTDIPHIEITRWYAFTGPCTARLEKGVLYLETMKPADRDAWLAKSNLKPDDKSLLFNAFPKTLTFTELRAMWKKENSGEIKWDERSRKYIDVPEGQRVPLGRARDFDPRNKPVIPAIQGM